ncbi:hypothetical protein TrLO_g4001 [Triparma laevis f. longispina]|uniref:FAD dependent oxidoreductase domain-containing protein n=1 Tax=Triparma laevis f. longispina TaxID=1714387 RepID=A0A9W7A5M6_9STRA|nr:hypothetical protein TrLO_g4001 [Triparma laevis f. longispina]
MEDNPRQRIVVIGAGLFGSATAKHLSILYPTLRITLLGPTSSQNPNTAHNDVSRLYRSTSPSAYWSDLAERSINEYATIKGSVGKSLLVIHSSLIF